MGAGLRISALGFRFVLFFSHGKSLDFFTQLFCSSQTSYTATSAGNIKHVKFNARRMSGAGGHDVPADFFVFDQLGINDLVLRAAVNSAK